MKLDRKLRMGLIGGGPGAFIGEVHRKASRLDGEIELVAGAFDIDPQKSKDMGKNLALDPKRVYSTYTDMIKAESALPKEQRIDFVAVTTPNNWHFPIARDFLKAGFHVMCEKPMALTYNEARDLRMIAKEKGLVFGLIHSHARCPMTELARDLARIGDLEKRKSHQPSHAKHSKEKTSPEPPVEDWRNLSVQEPTSPLMQDLLSNHLDRLTQTEMELSKLRDRKHSLEKENAVLRVKAQSRKGVAAISDACLLVGGVLIGLVQPLWSTRPFGQILIVLAGIVITGGLAAKAGSR